MTTSETISEREILEALQHEGQPLQQMRERFNYNLEKDREGTIATAKEVAKHILKDLDNFLDMHPQV